MFRLGILQSVGFATFLVATGASAAEPVYYSIQMKGAPIGYARISADDVTWNGQRLQRLRSETMFKVAMLGTQKQIMRRSDTLVDPKTDLLVHYELTNKTNDVTSHIECRFENGKVRRWSYAEGAPKGDAQETALPGDTRLLGSNNFAHWGVLLKAAAAGQAEGVARLSVFLPDLNQVATFQLARSPAKKNVKISGKTYSCVEWKLEGESVTLYVDSSTGQMIRMDLSSQATTVDLADASIVQTAETAGAQEVLAQHFAQSNVVFDDFLKVTALKAKLDVALIGSGVDNAESVLTTSMQEFDGRKDRDHVQGLVTIETRPYAGEQTPAFPADKTVDPKLAAWLRPEPLIECDDPTIAAEARRVAQGAADRWQAVLKIGRWVNHEIAYTIADSPSARLALKKRKGDCGPHATLMTAMLRSVGIPARLVGGLIFTPSFGGSFGQHAWVEVHMGPAGWVALDPTTGEFETLNATHIKLFEGMGGVIPNSLEVVSYEPTNAPPVRSAPAPARPLAWKFGQQYTYSFQQGGKSIGVQKFQIAKTKIKGADGYELSSTLDLAAGGVTIKSTTRLVVLANAAPASFHREIAAQGRKVTMDCKFQEGVVQEKISGATNLQRDIKLPAGAFCFDNNFIPCFAMICSQFRLREGKQIDIQSYHPSTMRIIPLSFHVKAAKKIKVSGRDIECFECDVPGIKNTFWIARDGRLVKVEAANLVIAVDPVE